MIEWCLLAIIKHLEPQGNSIFNFIGVFKPVLV